MSRDNRMMRFIWGRNDLALLIGRYALSDIWRSSVLFEFHICIIQIVDRCSVRRLGQGPN